MKPGGFLKVFEILRTGSIFYLIFFQIPRLGGSLIRKIFKYPEPEVLSFWIFQIHKTGKSLIFLEITETGWYYEDQIPATYWPSPGWGPKWDLEINMRSGMRSDYHNCVVVPTLLHAVAARRRYSSSFPRFCTLWQHGHDTASSFSYTWRRELHRRPPLPLGSCVRSRILSVSSSTRQSFSGYHLHTTKLWGRRKECASILAAETTRTN